MLSHRAHAASSGLGLRSFARYVVRGFVFSSASMRVVAVLLLQLRDPALRVVEVAEDDRLGRAGLLAGRHDLAVLAARGRPSVLAWIFASWMRCTQ